MLDSLFVVNRSGNVVLEKHWKSVVHRSICDYFYAALKEAPTPADVPVAIATPQHHYLLNVFRNQLFFVGVVKRELPPLGVIEFLHQLVDILIGYFDDCTETILKDNVVTVYELFSEMLDDGCPLNTEPNVLHELIPPPSFLRNISNTVTGRSNVGENLPLCLLSSTPWRRSDVRYANNEAYFDVVEEIDAIVDKNGLAVLAEVNGYLDCCIKLSGMPDLTMAFSNPRVFDDVSFHSCVRLKRWQSDRVLSFVPPDGNFRLMTFHLGSQSRVVLPVNVRQTFGFNSNQSGKLDVTVSVPKVVGKALEDVSLAILMPKYVLSCNVTPSAGRCNFDSSSKTLLWEIGKMDLTTTGSLRGTVTVQPTPSSLDGNPTTNVRFTVSQISLAGIKISRLDVYGERYRPFKGVKYVTRAGQYQIRG